MFTVNDVRQAEIQILEVCGWNPLYSTILELTEFYLAQGIVFTSDKLRLKTEVQVEQPKVLGEQKANL